MKKHSGYIPALHYHWLTRWYDPMMRWFFPEAGIHANLITQAHIQLEQTVLDVGCGTGTLTLLIKQAYPNVVIHGLDIDAKILQIAQRKARQAGQNILWQQGTATSLPYADQSLDHVCASLLLHHLTRQDKQHMLREALRVLKPGGMLHVADFGRPHDFGMWLISWFMRWFEEIHDNVLGLLPVFMTDTGFHQVVTTAHHRTVAGTIALYRAVKPLG
ncbi:class I SAM-dependent methyltransferase [Nitrosomonas ureae]|uniref:Ubiquinone/menaquinone biosynthesis C-methylase UbiE n=1 Tax=Nitrosomonas ureae TaxID=44577 RepID=A0A286A9C5_9PROT|nr:class I SAM-dependent methyltransferase [Nitrosomonas ureae]SOD18489.1 Ubiquinone/menaquinone biosynthesis C-methylase UbiE [Nitrosomonas ureae]